MGQARRIALPAILLVAASLPFLLGLTNEFAGDDEFLVFRRLDTVDVGRFFVDDYWAPVQNSGLYRPVALSILYVERLLFGTNPEGYHAVNLLLHAAVCLLLWRLASPIIGPSSAWLAALIFAVHPIHAEALLTVYGQVDLLAAAFLLAGITALSKARAGMLELTGAFALLVLAMLSKESTIIASLLYLLLQFTRRRTVERVRTPLVISILAAVVVMAARFAALGELTVPPESTVVAGGGAMLAFKAVIISVGHAIMISTVPIGQTIYYGHLRESLFGVPWADMSALAMAAGLFTTLWRLLPAKRLAFGAAWFGICVLPVANVIPIGTLVAERTLYLPSFGMAAIAAVGLVALRARWRRPRVRLAFVVAVTGLVVIAAAMSTRVAIRWRTQESLWRTTIEDHSGSPRAYAMLGHALLRKQGRTQEARSLFLNALQLNPDSGDALYGMGKLDAPC